MKIDQCNVHCCSIHVDLPPSANMMYTYSSCEIMTSVLLYQHTVAVCFYSSCCLLLGCSLPEHGEQSNYWSSNHGYSARIAAKL